MPVDRQSIPRPVFRNLRVFAVDPGMTARFETAVMNETTLRIPWEELDAGPVGRVHPRRRRERKRRDAPSAGRPRRSRGARAGRPAAFRRQSAVRPADGLRGRDAHDQELRACARPRRALAADRGRGHGLPQAAHALSALHGGAERLLHARRRHPLRLLRERRRNRSSPARSSSAACRRTSSPTRSLMPF